MSRGMNKRIWFDTEFIEDGKTIDLMSIGMVDEEGNTLYLESKECDLSRASEWVQVNVIPHLQGGDALVSRAEMLREIKRFAGYKPEFWAWYSSYDWITLCQLHGKMVDLPNHWPRYCRDFRQIVDMEGIDTKLFPKLEGNAHNALDDAIWLKNAHLSWEIRQ